MARALRMERAGAWYHIKARGTDRRVIFREDLDCGWPNWERLPGGVDYAAVGVAIKRFERRLKE